MSDLLRDALREEAMRHDFTLPGIIDSTPTSGVRPRRATVALAAAAVGVIGIGSFLVSQSIRPDETGGPAESTDEEPLISLVEPLNAIPAGTVGGVLELRSGCLAIEDAILVYAIQGATWDADRKAVVMPDGTRDLVGSVVGYGGGYVPATEAILTKMGESDSDQLLECMRAVAATSIALAASPLTKLEP